MSPSPLEPQAPHRLSPDEWRAIERTPAFRQLISAKRAFLIPATLFFLAYYFALPVLVGYFPRLMERAVVGRINLAYLFALSQFFVAWALMWLYVRRARRFDRMAEKVVAASRGEERR